MSDDSLWRRRFSRQGTEPHPNEKSLDSMPVFTRVEIQVFSRFRKWCRMPSTANSPLCRYAPAVARSVDPLAAVK